MSLKEAPTCNMVGAFVMIYIVSPEDERRPRARRKKTARRRSFQCKAPGHNKLGSNVLGPN